MSDIQPELILVVDDSPATRYSTVRQVRNAGFQVVEAANGMDGLRFAQQGCDLIVLDVNLPDIDGHEVCRLIRLQPSSARIPIIHLSASFVSDESKIRGLEAGADGYLTHPLEPLVLIATIKAFLKTRQFERALQRSEEKFRTIFDRALTGICLLSNDMIFLDANPSFCRVMGTDLNEIEGKHASVFIHHGAEKKILEISQHLQSHDTWQGLLPLLRSDSRTVELEWQISQHSEPGVWVAMASDITARRTIEVERESLLISERTARLSAERANRLKDEFLATLSHELRTPLNAIVGWTQILRFRPPSPQDLAMGLEVIERNARAQAVLIEDLLDVSRIMSGKLRLDVQPVDIAELVRDSLTGALPAAEAKGVSVTLELAADIGEILVDAARIRQVIWNLVNNAVKFTPKDGHVLVTLRRSPDAVIFRCSDTGQGITREFLPHLFEQFRQEDATTTRSHGGLGLGLAIVKHLVELHGGVVSAESAGEGQGAQFIVQLPVARPLEPTEIDLPETEPPVSAQSMAFLSQHLNLSGIRVLLIDDDNDARTVAARMLRELDANVKEASSADEALSFLVPFQPDVLVSDIGMPHQDGYDLIRLVRERGYDAQKLPAIALTAFARREDRDRAIDEGYQSHLTKPIVPARLASTITGLLRKQNH